MRLLGLSALCLVAGCSSADFSSGTPSADTGVLDTAVVDSGPEVVVDTGPGECALGEPGKPNICIDFVFEKSPGYGASTGADELKIDGRGEITLYVYASDPGDQSKPPPPPSVVTKKNVDVTKASGDRIITKVPASGVYYIVAHFKDADGARSESGTGAYRFGDLVTAPTFTTPPNRRPTYPRLETSGSRILEVRLRPFRRLNVKLDLEAEVKSEIVAATERGAHASGPIGFLLSDRVGNPVDFAFVNCVNLGKGDMKGNTVFGTSANADLLDLSVISALYDYDLPSGAAEAPTGTLLNVDLKNLNGDKLTLNPSSWLGDFSVRYRGFQGLKVARNALYSSRADDVTCD